MAQAETSDRARRRDRGSVKALLRLYLGSMTALFRLYSGSIQANTSVYEEVWRKFLIGHAAEIEANTISLLILLVH